MTSVQGPGSLHAHYAHTPVRGFRAGPGKSDEMSVRADEISEAGVGSVDDVVMMLVHSLSCSLLFSAPSHVDD